MSSNSITIPEELILENIQLGLEAIKSDFAASPTEQDSFLYRITKNSSLDRYELFKQAKSIFIDPSNRNEPKSVQVSMGFNLQRMNEPNVHILMESDSKGKEDGLGTDVDVADPYIDASPAIGASGSRTNVYTRNFDSRFNIMCSGSNPTELMLVYYVVRNLLYSMISDFDLNGFKNLKITGGSLNPQQQIADKFYLKSIFMEFDYDVEIPRLWKGKFGDRITVNNVTLKTEFDLDESDLAPASLAIVKDQDGNILGSASIASGGTGIITINVNEATMINVAKGDFTGGFDLSVQDQNGFYNDYESATIINTLSIAANPTLGALATVRIIGGSLAADAVPVNWAYSGDVISQDTDFYNEIMILYVSSTDIRIVNRLVDAPDVTSPLFAVAPASASIAETSFDITATLNENGTVYGYLLADGAAAPDTDTVIANAQQSFSDVGSGGTLSFTGLVDQTNYDIYVVAEDTIGNKQASPVLVEVFTQSNVSPEAAAVLANYTSLTAPEETKVINFVDYLVGEGVWNDIDDVLVQNLTNEADALISMKGLFSPTKIGTPSFVSGSGFDFNGTDTAINLGVNLDSFTQYVQDDGFFALNVATNDDINSVGYAFGVVEAGQKWSLLSNAANQDILWAINEGSTLNHIDTNGLEVGFYDVRTNGASAKELLFNGVLEDGGSRSSVGGTSTEPLYLGARNVNGSINNPFDGIVNILIIGKESGIDPSILVTAKDLLL